MWPFSKIRHLEKAVCELADSERSRREVDAAIRGNLCVWIDNDRSGKGWNGRIVRVKGNDSGKPKEGTVCVQPFQGRRKQPVWKAKEWAREVLFSFGVGIEGVACMVEYRDGPDGEVRSESEDLK